MQRGQKNPLTEYAVIAIVLLAIFLTILYILQTKVLPQ